MGAQRLSGQHQTVRPLVPSSSGAGTPQSMFPVMRNGSRHLPVRKRTPAASSFSRASSRASQPEKVSEKDCWPPSASVSVCSGSWSATAS